MKILKAGILYFAIVFGTGFVLGPIRILWVAPRFGTRMAELMETPIMIAVIIVAAGGSVQNSVSPFNFSLTSQGSGSGSRIREWA